MRLVGVLLICLALIEGGIARPATADDDFSATPFFSTPNGNLRIPQKEPQHSSGASAAGSRASPTKYGLQKSDEEVERLLVRISNQFQTIEDLRRELKEQNEVCCFKLYYLLRANLILCYFRHLNKNAKQNVPHVNCRSKIRKLHG